MDLAGAVVALQSAMPIGGWRFLAAALVFGATAGCAFDIGFSAARFRCDSVIDCPAGELCEGGYCALPAPGTSPAGEVGGADAAAAQAEPPVDAQLPDAQELILQPVADAYVDAAAPLDNHGTSEQLRVDGDPATTAYLRFVRGGGGDDEALPPIASARLELYAFSNQAAGYRVSAAQGGWSEATITFASAPAIGEPSGSSGAVSAGSWTSVDVTAEVGSENEIDLALTTSDATALALASREDEEYIPRLVIVVAPR